MTTEKPDTALQEYFVGDRVMTKFNPGGLIGTVERVETVMPGVISFYDWPYKVRLDGSDILEGYSGDQLEDHTDAN